MGSLSSFRSLSRMEHAEGGRLSGLVGMAGWGVSVLFRLFVCGSRSLLLKK